MEHTKEHINVCIKFTLENTTVLMHVTQTRVSTAAIHLYTTVSSGICVCFEKSRIVLSFSPQPATRGSATTLTRRVQFAILKIRHSHLRSRDTTTKRGENSLCFSTWRHRFLILPRIKHQARQFLSHASPSRCRVMPAFASCSLGDAETRRIFKCFCCGTRGHYQLPKHPKRTLRQLTHWQLMSRRTKMLARSTNNSNCIYRRRMGYH